MDKDPSVANPLQPLCLLESSDHVTYTSSLLTSKELKILEDVLHQNKNVFAWTHFDMPKIHQSVALHQLNITPFSRPIHQKVRRFHTNRQKIIQSEVDKLLATGFIREVESPDWLANIVIIPKK